MATSTISDGYAAVAHIMSARGLSTFKRFSSLNMQNLLYLQAELLSLERELRIIADMDAEEDAQKNRNGSNERAAPRAMSWVALSHNKDQQWQKFLEIRAKLDEYNRALIQQAEIDKFSQARQYDHQVLRSYVFGNAKEGRPRQIMKGLQMLPFREESLADMIVLQPRPQLDLFTRTLAEHVVPWIYRQWLHIRQRSPSKDIEMGSITEIADNIFVRIARLTGVAIAALFPAVSVLTLYYISSLPVRLGMIMVYTVIFPCILAVFTRATSIEIFAAVAACASVQVVFVGSTSTLR